MNITRSLQLTENRVVDITPVTVTSCMNGTVLPPKRWCSVERQNKASLSDGNLSCCSKISLDSWPVMILNTQTDMFPLHTQDMTLYCLKAAMYDVYK